MNNNITRQATRQEIVEALLKIPAIESADSQRIFTITPGVSCTISRPVKGGEAFCRS